jgi:hypothetical protein
MLLATGIAVCMPSRGQLVPLPPDNPTGWQTTRDNRSARVAILMSQCADRPFCLTLSTDGTFRRYDGIARRAFLLFEWDVCSNSFRRDSGRSAMSGQLRGVGAILRRTQVEHEVGLKRSTIYKPYFPQVADRIWA